VAATLVFAFSADAATGIFCPEDDVGGGGNDQTVVVQLWAGRPPPSVPPQVSPPGPPGEDARFSSVGCRVFSAAGLVDAEESVDMDCDSRLDVDLAPLEQDKEAARAAALPPPRPLRLRRAELRFRRLLPLVLGPLPALGHEEGVAIPGPEEWAMVRAGECKWRL